MKQGARWNWIVVMMFCSVVGAILDCGGIQAIYFAHVHDALIMLILISNMADVLDEQEEVLQDMECTDMDYRKMRQSQEAVIHMLMMHWKFISKFDRSKKVAQILEDTLTNSQVPEVSEMRLVTF